MTKDEGRLDDEEDAQKSDKDVDDIKHDERLLEEDPGEDDHPDWGASTDHVDISHGHVFETIEVNDEVGGSHH